MKRIIGILVITVLMSVNFALATETNNTQLDSNQDGSKINLNPKNLPICDSQPYDNCFAVLGKYSGEFHNGKFDGLGKYLMQDFTSRVNMAYFIGNFKDDKKNGHFSLYSSENGNKIFVGDFINGKQSGKGVYYYANGDINDSCFLNHLKCANDLNKKSSDLRRGLNMPNVPARQGGLAWSLPLSSANWNEANNYCNSYALYSLTGWRLPTKDELSSLYQASHQNPEVLNEKKWTLGGIWTSTLSNSKNFRNSHFAFNLELGSTYETTDRGMLSVACVQSINEYGLNMPNVKAKQGEVIALKPKEKSDQYKGIADGGGYDPKNAMFTGGGYDPKDGYAPDNSKNGASNNVAPKKEAYAESSKRILEESEQYQRSQQHQTIQPIQDGVKLTMLEVINSCGENYSFNKFNDYADCVRYSYNTYGSAPSHPSVKAFYIFLDEIVEESNRGAYGIAKAKGEMLRAWQSTIDTNNRGAATAATSNANAESANDLTRLQILQQQQILDQQDQQRRIYLLNEAQRLLSPPKSTNCTSTMVGNTVQTNCY